MAVKTQPKTSAKLRDPNFWRLVDVQNRPTLGKSGATRTLVGTAKSDYGVGGSCVNFLAAGDRISYGADSNLQLSTMTGIAVVEIPATAGLHYAIFDTNANGPISEGFALIVYPGGAVNVNRADSAAIGITIKTVKLGTGISTITWSYNNITGKLRVAIDGTIETFTSAQTLLHGNVERNGYYPFPNATYSNPHKQYLFALAASDWVADAQLRDWSIDPYAIFADEPDRRLWAASTTPPSSFNPAWARGSNQTIGFGAL